MNRLISEGNLEEAADKTTAIDNGANSEAPNVIINARSSAAGQVFNKQLINELK